MKYKKLFQPLSAMAGLSTILFSSSAYGQLYDFSGTWRDFTIIGYSTVTNTGTSVVSGNVALSPGTAITGFPPGLVVNGTIYSAPNPIYQQIAQLARTDAQNLYNTIAVIPTNMVVPGINAQQLGGKTLTAGVYSLNAADLTGDLTLNAPTEGETFIFKIDSTLTVASGARVIITGAGADCVHIYWQVGSSATLGTTAEFQGTIVANASVTINTGAQLLNGGAYALNGAVTLDTNNLEGPDADCEPGGSGGSGGSGGIAFSSLYSLISPDELTAIFQIGFSAAGAQNSNIMRHLELVRRGGPPAPQAPYIPEQNDSKSGMHDSKSGMHDSKSGMRDSKDGLANQTEVTQQDNLWSVYLEGTGASATVDPSTNATGYRFDTRGATLGADRRINNNLVFGVLGSYNTSDADLFDNGSIEGESYKGAIYATLYKDGFFLDALVGGGYNSYDIRRAALMGNAEGSPDGWELNTLLNGGYDIHRGKWTITPSASVAFTRVTLNGYTETGSSSALLQYPTQSQESLLTDVGVRVAYSTMVLGMVVTPQVRLSWQHEYLDSTQSLEARALPGPAFSVSGPEIDRDRAVLSAGLDVLVTPTVSVYAHYDGQLGNSNYNYNSMTVGFMVNF